MPNGLMVVNAFLQTNKFSEIYQTLLAAARNHGISLEPRTNAELCAEIDDGFDPARYDFALFWDKDVQLAAQLESKGLRLFNSADGVLRCDDKALTYLTLQNRGIAMPRTVIAPKTFANIGYPNLDFVERIANRLGFPLVLKECFGSFGQQVYLFYDLASLRRKVGQLAGTPLLFQEMVTESFGRDARLNVVGGRVVASILRQSTDGDFRSNLSRGGAMKPYAPTPEEEALALRAAKLLGLDFAGVDVLFGKDGPVLCEVNSNAHFKTTLQCTGVNMADCIMRHIGKEIG